MLEHAGEELTQPMKCSRGRTDAGFLRQRDEQFRRAAVARRFSRRAPRRPQPRPCRRRTHRFAPDDPQFSGFIFKIQANMDPKHRDRIAFVRVCSGKFERDMTVTHARTGEEGAPLQFAQAFRAGTRDGGRGVRRATSSDSSATREFGIGDTLTEDPTIAYHEIPRFPPECFAYAAQSEHRRSSNNSARAWINCCRKASSRSFYLRESASTSAAARRGRSAAIRSRAVPVGNGIRRAVATRNRIMGNAQMAASRE